MNIYTGILEPIPYRKETIVNLHTFFIKNFRPFLKNILMQSIHPKRLALGIIGLYLYIHFTIDIIVF